MGLVKILKSLPGDKWISVGSCELRDSIEYDINASDVGSKIKFEILPMDINGNAGSVKSVITGEVKASFVIDPVFTSTWDSGVISANVRFDNNYHDKDIVIMLGLFDERNVMHSITEKHVVVQEGQMIDVPVSIPANNESAKARLFIWDGSSSINTTMASLKGSISLEKN
jgi:hypothetical protein